MRGRARKVTRGSEAGSTRVGRIARGLCQGEGRVVSSREVESRRPRHYVTCSGVDARRVGIAKPICRCGNSVAESVRECPSGVQYDDGATES